jgi:hypothetical protein
MICILIPFQIHIQTQICAGVSITTPFLNGKDSTPNFHVEITPLTGPTDKVLAVGIMQRRSGASQVKVISLVQDGARIGVRSIFMQKTISQHLRLVVLVVGG